MSNEDVIPKWVLEIVPDHKDYGGSTTEHWRGRAMERAWTQQRLRVLHRCVCIPCNTGWMSRLEYAVEPFLGPMILGHGHRLDEAQRRLVAAWAVKTAMTLQGRDPEAVPLSHRREVMDYCSQQEPEPPPGMQVWLGAYQAASYGYDYLHVHIPLFLGEDAARSRAPNGYGSTFNIGHTVFQVFRSEDRPPAERYIGGDLLTVLSQAWPAAGSLVWPPQAAVNRTGLYDVAWNYWGDWADEPAYRGSYGGAFVKGRR